MYAALTTMFLQWSCTKLNAHTFKCEGSYVCEAVVIDKRLPKTLIVRVPDSTCVNEPVNQAMTVCPATEFVNVDIDSDKLAKESYERAKTRCGELYPKSPCVIKFIKSADGAFQVICGARRKP